MRDNKEGCSGSILVKILAVIGAITVIAGIAYAVYRFFAPDYIEDLEDDFDDYFDDEDEYEEDDEEEEEEPGLEDFVDEDEEKKDE